MTHRLPAAMVSLVTEVGDSSNDSGVAYVVGRVIGSLLVAVVGFLIVRAVYRRWTRHKFGIDHRGDGRGSRF